MSLQEPMHFLREFRTDPLRRCNLFHARFAESIHRTKFPQQQIFPVLAHARTIIKNAFADTFFHEQLMIGVSEAMGLVADTLEQSQSARRGGQLQRQRPAGPINLFVLLGQADNWKIVQAKPLQFAARCRELTFSTIDNDQIRKTNERSPVFFSDLDVERWRLSARHGVARPGRRRVGRLLF